MSLVETIGSDVAPAVARRAVDLARDARTPATDGAEHLTRLSLARRDVLEAALAELERRPPSVDGECASGLVARAIDMLDER